jgi:deoxyadenosine/deoxycytidine kinase
MAAQAAALPPARPGAAAPPKVIIVEGEIGVGKSEFVISFGEALRALGKKVCVIPEPVDKWHDIGILKLFYADPVKHGYMAQTFFNATRISAIVAAHAAMPDADIYLLERSPATDRIFMELQRPHLTPLEMDMYEVWADTYRGLMPFDLGGATVLYLKTSLETCMARLKTRKRGGEICEEKRDEAAAPTATPAGGVSAEYQARLRRGHELFLLGDERHAAEFPRMPKSPFARANVHVVDAKLADVDFRAGSPRVAEVTSAIITQIGMTPSAVVIDSLTESVLQSMLGLYEPNPILNPDAFGAVLSKRLQASLLAGANLRKKDISTGYQLKKLGLLAMYEAVLMCLRARHPNAADLQQMPMLDNATALEAVCAHMCRLDALTIAYENVPAEGADADPSASMAPSAAPRADQGASRDAPCAIPVTSG